MLEPSEVYTDDDDAPSRLTDPPPLALGGSVSERLCVSLKAAVGAGMGGSVGRGWAALIWLARMHAKKITVLPNLRAYVSA